MTLGKISETILEECTSLQNVKRPCQDNLTLIIVSLADYLNDWKQQCQQTSTEQLAIQKMTSQMFKASTAGSSFNDGADFANVSSSNASNSLNESGLQSNADA